MAAHAGLIPGLGNGIPRRGLGHPLVKSSFEERHQRHAGQLLLKPPNARGVGRIMSRGDVLETLERSDHPLISGHAAGEIAAQHRLEADAVQIRRGLDVARGLELREAVVNGATVIRHPFVAAPRQQRRPRPVKAEETKLEGGRAKIGDEDVHGWRRRLTESDRPAWGRRSLWTARLQAEVPEIQRPSSASSSCGRGIT